MRPPIFFGNAGASIATVVAFWVVFYVWFAAELYLGYRSRRLPSGTVERDNGSKWWLIASVWVTVTAGIWIAERFPDAAIKGGREVVFIIGLVLMIAGLALRWYSISVLGTSFTCNVATHPGQQVVQSGPYRWIRHPSYTGGLLTVLGVLVCCLNWASLAALIVVAFGYANRIRVEERALAANLGPAYRDYMRRTRRLIPFLI
jgi:protein-S-isoprenylcysteine O-methyltransferase Ste14